MANGFSFQRLGEAIAASYAKGREQAIRQQQQQRVEEDSQVLPPGFKWTFKTRFDKGVPRTVRVLEEIKPEKEQTPFQQVRDIKAKKELEQLTTPAVQAPGFEEAPQGQGFLPDILQRLQSFRNPQKAVINDATRRVIGRVQSLADLEELMEDIESDPEQFTQVGIDPAAIREYYGR